MNQALLIYPLFTMALLSLIIGLLMLAARIEAVKSGKMKASSFILNSGEQTDKVTRFKHHYENLFEVPILFYVAIIIVMICQIGDTLYLTLAWSYVALRIAHAYIHTTYNYVPHRMVAFLGSIFVLYWIWGRVAWQMWPV